MTDGNRIAREWVEIREESKDSSFIFRPIDYPIPPARGRRHLKLIQQGKQKAEGVGEGLESGPTDKMEAASIGSWKVNKKILYVSIPGWEGKYQIEELQDDILVLHKLDMSD